MTYKFTNEQRQMQMISMRNRSADESSNQIAQLKAELKVSEKSRQNLLRENVALKKAIERMNSGDRESVAFEAKYKKAAEDLEKYKKLKEEIAAYREEIEELREELSCESDSKLVEENKKLREQIKNQEETDRLLEEVKQMSRDTDASSNFYNRLEELESENKILKEKLEQKKSIAQLLDSQLITIQNAASTLSPNEVYMALKFRYRQLSDLNSSLRGDYEEDEEEDIEYNENNMDKLRTKINSLQEENLELRGGSSPPRTSTSFMTNFNTIQTQIKVLKEKNAQLKETTRKQIAKMNNFGPLEQCVDELDGTMTEEEAEEKLVELQKILRELIAEVYQNENSGTNEVETLKDEVETLIKLCQSLATQKGCESIVSENIKLAEELRTLKEMNSNVCCLRV